MEKVSRSSLVSNLNLIWVGIGLALLYWLLESIMHISVFNDGDLISQLLRPIPHELWKRLFVASLVILFGIYAQKTIDIRKRTESALAQREQELTTILENNPAGIMLVDAETRIVNMANTNALMLVNSTRDRVENHICHKHLCPMEADNCPILDRGQSVDSSERILRNSEGINIPILKSVTRVQYKGRQHLLEAFFNISDQKKMEQDLRLAHAELNQIFQTASVAMRLISRDFRILKINKTFERLADVKESDAIGDKCYNVFPGPACYTARCSMHRVVEDKKSVECYVEKQRADGNIIPCFLTATPFVGPDGNIIGIVESFLDITLQKRAQEAVEAERDKLNRILSHLHEGVSIISKDYVLEYQNDVFSEYFGSCADKPCYSIIHGRENPCEPCIMDAAIQTGQIRHVEFQTADGRSLEKIYTPVTDGDSYAKVVGLWRDVTAQKAATAAIVRTEQLAALGELAAGVAHEINNPINGIINYAQILYNKSEEGSLFKDISGRVIREGDRIARIVEGLLSFTRGRNEEKAYVSIAEVLNESLTLLSSQLRRENIIVQTAFADGLPRIFAQAHEIEQVFINVISNARHALNGKYPDVHENKILQITADKATCEHSDYVRVFFRDHGTGIPADIIDKVKNPFFSTKTEKNRTGLGLSISNAIITEHKGRLNLKSEFGRYTDVTIDLPCPKEPKP